MHSPRSSIRAIAILALIAASVPIASASASIVQTERPVAKGDTISIDVVRFADYAVLVRDLVIVTKVDVVAGVQVIELSARTRGRLQASAVDHAIYSMVRSGDVAPDSFGRYVLDALVDDVGADMAKAVARSCRPSPAAYRRVLDAIHDRNRSSDAST